MASKNAYSQILDAANIWPISGGYVFYTFDPDTGDIVGKGEAHLPIGMKKSFDTKNHVDPKILVSANFKKPGTKMAFGDLHITVNSPLDNGHMLCDVTYADAVGTAIVDVSGKYIKLQKIDAVGKVFRFNLHLVLTARA